jgi:hypothetical protein
MVVSRVGPGSNQAIDQMKPTISRAIANINDTGELAPCSEPPITATEAKLRFPGNIADHLG